MASDDRLNHSVIELFRQEVIARWAKVGVSEADLTPLLSVQIEFADLSGNILGRSLGNAIALDLDAGGQGWYVDPEPGSDTEFELGNSGKDAIAGKVDLLTVMAHEMGHVLGISHSSASDSLMQSTLSGGTRRLPTAGDLMLRDLSALKMSHSGEFLSLSDSSLINGLGGSNGFGENILGRNDDGSTGFIDVTSVFESGLNFFGTTYNGLYINNNGNITFGSSSSTYTPFALTGNTGRPIIAPFFTDIDTRSGNLIPSAGGNSTGSNLVYWDIDPTTESVTITWDDVGEYSSGTTPNAFQLRLQDLGQGNFSFEFRYEDIQWYRGNARAGYSAANGTNFFELPQSGTSAMLDLEKSGNTGQAGLFLFSVVNGNPNQPPTDIVISQSTVNENSLHGITIATLSTLDPDANDFHTYTLLDDAGGRFALDGNRLVVAEGASLNYEDSFSHSVTVRTRDIGGLTYDKAFTISVNNVPEPDLIATTATFTATANLGETIPVNWTVVNQGDGTTLGNWIDNIYLSKDAIWDTTDVLLGSQSPTGSSPLVAGASYSLSENITIPTNTPTGIYYLLVVTDRENRQLEGYENNNIRAIALEIQAPDLAVESVSIPATVTVGETLTVDWTVTNVGNGVTKSNWYDRIYLSSDDKLDNSDISLTSVLGIAPLAAGASYTSSSNILIPQIDPSQKWYLLLVADGSRSQSELEEANNLLVRELQVKAPDLIVSATTAPNIAESGNGIDVSWTVTNQGDGAALGQWYDSVYLSDDNQLDNSDRLLANELRNSLASRQSYTVTQNLTLPQQSGSKYLIFVTDRQSQQSETQESNNAKAVEITLSTPDLVVSAVNAPTFTIGDPARVNISWTVNNAGDSTSKSWSDRIIASSDEILGNSDDKILATYTRTGLAANSSYSRAENILLPTGFQGRYRLFVQTDATGQVFENGLEANNSKASANFFDVTPKPYADLIVDRISTNPTANSGQPLTISWKTVNQGIGVTDRDSTFETIELATDPEGRNIIAKLGTFERLGALTAGDSYERTVDVNLPNGLSGNYYLVATTSGAYEFIYGNNNTKVSSAINLVVAPPIDLVVQNITTPTRAKSGDRIDISWTVGNQGEREAEGAWTDTVYLQLVGQPDAPKIALGSFTYNGNLSPQGNYTRSEQFTLANNLTGDYQIFVTTNATNSIYEHLGNNNNTAASSQTLEVSLPPRPDLRVKEIIAPQTIAAGGKVSLEFIVENLGLAATKAPNWIDKVYLSLDGQISADDIVLGAITNGSALNPGESYRSQTQLLTVPQRYQGSMYLLLSTDADNQVEEYPREHNNVQAIAVNVTPYVPSDLVTSDVVAPTQGIAGNSVEVRYKVTNRGRNATNTETWTDMVWLTRDKNRPSVEAAGNEPGDIILGSFSHSGTLAVGESYEQVVRVKLPELSGEWYITAWSNPYGTVLEETTDIYSNPDDPNQLDNNNYKARAITILANPPSDLAVTAISPTVSAKGGDNLVVSWTVQNQGATTRVNSWKDVVYLSNSPTLETPGAQIWKLGEVVRNGALDSQQSYTGRLETRLSPAASGRYIIVETNASNSVAEGIYTQNNTLAADTNVTKLAPSDLVVSAVKTENINFSGEKTRIQWTVTNQGGDTWDGTKYWYDEVWISPDPTFIPERATKVGFFLHTQPEPLKAGSSYTQVQDIVLPKGINGDYYIYVSTDYAYGDRKLGVDERLLAKYRGEIPQGSQINDSNRDSFVYRVFEDPTNNIGSASLPITYREPDLVISNLVVPNGANSGESVAVQWTVTNTGTRQTRESSWIDRVYLSKDKSLDKGDIELGKFSRSGKLDIGQSYIQNGTITLPDGIGGQYYLIAWTDAGIPGIVPEFGDEGNNTTIAALPVTLTVPPDLQVTSVIAPQRITKGQNLDISYTVKNAGLGNTPTRQSNWNDLIYLSRDQFLDLQADRYLGYVTRDGALAAGESYSVNQTLSLPSDVTGAFYVFVVTDPFQNGKSSVYEGSKESNNAKASAVPFIVEVPPPSDLQVDTITLPNSAKSGEKIQIQWQVTNHGNNPASGNWYDAAYLSTDGIWDINDKPLGRVAYSGTLAAGQSYTSSLETILPPTLPGQYRVIVRPDILDSVYEGENEVNNRTTSANPLNVSVEALQLDVGKDITLNSGETKLYQIAVGVGQTLKIDLKTPASDAINELFIAKDRAPTSISYDVTSLNSLAANQSAIVATTEPGTYYILVRGDSQPNTNTPATLTARLLPFGITDITTDRGGDSRYVSTTITGAQFDKNAIVKLVRPGIAEYQPVSYQVIDSTKIQAIFDFSNAPHGLYDVKVINPGGNAAILPYRYLVERAIAPDVSLGLGGSRILSPGDTGTYGVSVQSLTNIDTPYVQFQIGAGGKVGNNPYLFDLPYLQFSSNLQGRPQTGLQDLPWASLVSDLGGNGTSLAPGYIYDLANRSSVGQTFNVQTYAGLQEQAKKWDMTVDELLGFLKREGSITDDLIGFAFNVNASAKVLSRSEFVTQQVAAANQLRQSILADSTASIALKFLAADGDTWNQSYLAALETAGFLRPEGSAPPIRQNPLVTSMVTTLATGILAGKAGEQIITDGNLVGFFEKVRQWYGVGAQSVAPVKTSAKTHEQSFNIYVPFGNFRPELPPGVDVPPPQFSRFFNGGALGELAAITGPVGYGDLNYVPVNSALPYAIRFENAANAGSNVGEVRILTKLDEDLDLRSFQLGDLKIGDLQIHIPTGKANFQGDFDFTRTKGFILRVSAGLDLPSRTVSWLLQSIDPETGEVMQNSSLGLLPPNDASGKGSGTVSYSVKPKSVAGGADITSSARVIYNTAAPIDTSTIRAVVDGIAPISSVNATAVSPGSSDYLVQWQAADDATGSGVKHVTVYVAEDGGDFQIWQQQTQATSGYYQGRAGHTYEFLALATDNAGNQERPRLGVSAPNDGSSVNLGSLPSFVSTPIPDLGAPPAPSPQPATNALFIEAQQAIPNASPVTQKSEFTQVLRPFSAKAWATGIPTSHGNIAPMAIAILPDGSTIFSGGVNRGSLYRLGADGGRVSTPLATLSQPIFDLAADSQGRLWGTTGGGALLQLNPQTGQILQQFGDGITQSLAIQQSTGLIYVSSGDGIEIFNPNTQKFQHYSDLRVGNLAFAPDGKLWATTWPERGAIVSFDEKGKASKMLELDGGVDSLAFGQNGTKLAGLMFVSSNEGRLEMVDLATLKRITVAAGGSRGDIVRTTADGKVLLSQSGQIDLLQPVTTPRVIGTNPPPDATITLPSGRLAIAFDSDMLQADASQVGSVINPNNYLLVGENGGIIAISSVTYDAANRTAWLNFDALSGDRYHLQVSHKIQSAEAITLGQNYVSDFTAIDDILPFIDLKFANARSDRASQTVSYDVTLTNRSQNDLILPLYLSLDPNSGFTGQPVGSTTQTNTGAYLIDLSSNLVDGRLKAGESITSRTLTIYNPNDLRVDLAHNIYTLPYANAAPIFTSNPLTTAKVGENYQYNLAATDPDGSIVSYLLVSSPEGMNLDANTGLLSWLPTSQSSAEAKVVLQAYDARGGKATQEFTVNVSGGNRQPVWKAIAPEIRIAEGKPLEIAVAATDADGNRLTYYANNLPNGAIFDTTKRLFSWTPGYNAAGTYADVTFTVTDGINEVSQKTTILVIPTNQAPNFVKPVDRTVREGEIVRFKLQASDPDAVGVQSVAPVQSGVRSEEIKLTYFSNLLPAGATLDPNTGEFVWTPTYSYFK